MTAPETVTVPLMPLLVVLSRLEADDPLDEAVDTLWAAVRRAHQVDDS